MAKIILFFTINLFSLHLFAQWGEEPFVYVAPKSIQPVKKLHQNRRPASLDVQVKEISAEKQDSRKLDKDFAEKVVSNEVSPKMEKKTESVPDQNKEWEKLKNEFQSGKILKQEEPKEVAKFIKKTQRDILIGFDLSIMNFRSKSDYSPRNYESSAVLYESKIGIGFRKNLSGYFSYGSSSKMFIEDNPDGSSNTSMDYSNIELGIVYRSLQNSDFYLDWIFAGRESSISVSKSSNYSMGVKTASVLLGLDYVQSWSKDSSFSIKGRIYPKPNQLEESDGNWQYQSGSDPEVVSAQLGFSYSKALNNNFKFEIFYKHFFEQAQYTGSSGAADPSSSITITNTRVKTEWNSLGFGLAWEY